MALCLTFILLKAIVGRWWKTWPKVEPCLSRISLVSDIARRQITNLVQKLVDAQTTYKKTGSPVLVLENRCIGAKLWYSPTAEGWDIGHSEIQDLQAFHPKHKFHRSP